MKHVKQLLSALLVLAVVLSLLPAGVLKASAAEALAALDIGYPTFKNTELLDEVYDLSKLGVSYSEKDIMMAIYKQDLANGGDSFYMDRILAREGVCNGNAGSNGNADGNTFLTRGRALYMYTSSPSVIGFGGNTAYHQPLGRGDLVRVLFSNADGSLTTKEDTSKRVNAPSNWSSTYSVGSNLTLDVVKFIHQENVAVTTMTLTNKSAEDQAITVAADSIFATEPGKVTVNGAEQTELTAVVNELKSIEDGDEEKGFLGLFKKGGNKIANMKAKYAKAEVNVDKICKVLEGHQIQLLKDAAMLDQMYQLNLTYYKELSMYILAGKEKIQQVKEQELPELIKRAEESGLPEDTQKAKDLAELCNRFEKKIYDLELTRTISMQMAPQIRLIQSNDTAMSEKIQSTLVNTIPLWKSQMVLAIGVEHSAQAAKAQREVTDMTNTLLKKNAETLKLATVETAKESERGIVDIETLKQTNETLISTLDEVLQIQEDGRNKRREAEAELTQIETTMRNKLMEMSRTKQ